MELKKLTVSAILILIIGVCLGLQIKHLNIQAEETPVTFPITYPLSYPITYPASDFASLFDDDIISIPEGATTSATTSVRAETEIVLSTSSPDGTNTILIPAETIITRTDLGDIDISDIIASYISSGTFSGFTSNISIIRALEWGIPSVGLEFDRPITISIYVGDGYNGHTFGISRSTSTSSGWTNDGIVYPGNCLVSNGLCTFQTTKASYFVAAEESQPSNSSSSSSSSGGGGSSQPAPATCNYQAPSSPPDLFRIDAKATSATLYFSPASGQVSSYYISYGLTPGDQRYGTEISQGYSPGVLSFTIDYLKQRTDYYIRIRGGNGCMPGTWSGEMKITTTSGKAVTKFYKSLAKKITNILPKKTTSIPKSNVLGAVSPERTPETVYMKPVQNIQTQPQRASVPNTTNSKPPTRTPTPAPTPKPQRCFLIFCF